MSKDKTPWRTYQQENPGKMPGEQTLARWRSLATKLAKSIGARRACDICKRPVNRYGYIWLRAVAAWRAPPKKRRICYSCHVKLDMILQELEANGARDHLPPDDFSVAPHDAAATKGNEILSSRSEG